MQADRANAAAANAASAADGLAADAYDGSPAYVCTGRHDLARGLGPLAWSSARDARGRHDGLTGAADQPRLRPGTIRPPAHALRSVLPCGSLADSGRQSQAVTFGSVGRCAASVTQWWCRALKHGAPQQIRHLPPPLQQLREQAQTVPLGSGRRTNLKIDSGCLRSCSLC